MALSLPQLLSIISPIHLQILTQAPLFSHFPSKNLNKYTSSQNTIEMPTWPSKNHTTAPPRPTIYSITRTYNVCEIVMYALSFPQRISIIPLQILTQAPPFSHFPSKNLNNYTSILKYHRNAYMS